MCLHCFVARGDNEWLWMGLTDKQKEGQFMWNSGTLLTIEHWWGEQRSQGNPDVDCVVILTSHHRHTFYIRPCSEIRPFLCEVHLGETSLKIVPLNL